MTASPVSTSSVKFNPESRLYIDGELRDSVSGRTADNINPATEEVLGVATDAGAEDMEVAVAAARRAFDSTDWSTNREFRQHCLMQLHNALQEEKEYIRAELIAEVGAPLSSTYIAQLEWPIADAVGWPARYISEFAWERALPDGALLGSPYHRKVVKEAVG
ncbi:aldehyde dehydrogenase family protein, partial [Mycobacterium paraseoulense]